MSEYPAPTSDNYTILSRSLVTDAVGRRDYANSSIYRAPSGAWVFATGSNHWSLGLGQPGSDQPADRAGDRQHPQPVPGASRARLRATGTQPTVESSILSTPSSRTSRKVVRSRDTWPFLKL